MCSSKRCLRSDQLVDVSKPLVSSPLATDKFMSSLYFTAGRGVRYRPRLGGRVGRPTSDLRWGRRRALPDRERLPADPVLTVTGDVAAPVATAPDPADGL